jgi:hypothetical protein
VEDDEVIEESLRCDAKLMMIGIVLGWQQGKVVSRVRRTHIRQATGKGDNYRVERSRKKHIPGIVG